MNPSSVPILVLGFNRPDRVRQLLASLSTLAPQQLFFAVDGPRRDRPSDQELVTQTQKSAELINWDCEIHTQFQVENLGCGRGVTAGIDWFFSHVPEGIILEDDIILSPSFFPFCAELLDKYRDDNRVWCVSGSNRLPQEKVSQDFSYRFSTIPQIWGWATWADRWKEYAFDISGWRSNGLSSVKLLQTVNYRLGAFAYWSANFDLMAKMAVDTWDIQLINAAMRNGGLGAIPNVNLVENLGWGEEATHTKATPGFIQPVSNMTFPLTHPTVVVDSRADKFMNQRLYQATPLGLVQQYIRYRAAK
jgi:hypothetical protein